MHRALVDPVKAEQLHAATSGSVALPHTGPPGGEVVEGGEGGGGGLKGGGGGLVGTPLLLGCPSAFSTFIMSCEKNGENFFHALC